VVVSQGYPGNRHMVLERRAEISTIDIIDRILDKGLVIDYEARISVLGVDICTSIEARVVMASIDTYIRYAPTLRTAARVVDRLAGAEKGRQY
jgi:hypothetical protein